MNQHITNERLYHSRSSPLLNRSPTDTIFHITQALTALDHDCGPIDTQQFLADAYALSEQLPDKTYAINHCHHRYLFALVFCAVLIRQQTNILPPNKKPATLERLYDLYRDSYLIHDGCALLRQAFAQNPLKDKMVSTLDLSSLNLRQYSKVLQPKPQPTPLIPIHHIAAISFTSGSTGDSKPIEKSWKTLSESSAINAKHMLKDDDTSYFQIATVPPQHMWGLETTILLPLFAPICAPDKTTLFATDLQHHLNQTPNPILLVTAPIHLRTFIGSGLAFSKVTQILCATAPLSESVARAAESCFQQAILTEIYGCSEVGSMAYRRTSKQKSWQLFSEISLSQQADGLTIASANHLSDPVILQDTIKLESNPENIANQNQAVTFQLTGRSSDMVCIAGKRASLSEITQLMMNFSGIQDGVVMLPEAQKGTPRLSALVVLKENSSTGQLKRYLQQHLDSAFIPRTILEVKRLPRTDVGKLKNTDVISLYQKELLEIRRKKSLCAEP